MDLILDYYQDWDSENSPVMMTIEVLDGSTESFEAQERRKLGYLRKKYKNPG
ncbi:MAG: hypothetical protein ACXAAI_11335 [Promethearchaeota archaeon]|jgi:hypothetical protein